MLGIIFLKPSFLKDLVDVLRAVVQQFLLHEVFHLESV